MSLGSLSATVARDCARMAAGPQGPDHLSAVDWQAVHDRLEPFIENAQPALACEPVPASAPHGFWPWLLENHRRNARLWAQEDLARRRHAPDADIVANKRAIDLHNQARNDAVEHMDRWLLDHWATDTPQPHTRLHSETPGSMIDRLSILWLKIRAMQAQTQRQDLDLSTRQACTSRLAVLQEQRSDLAGCLATLLGEFKSGQSRFKLYRQFKMYNDSRLNPVLARESAPSPPSESVVPAGTPLEKTPGRPPFSCAPAGGGTGIARTLGALSRTTER